MILDAAFIERRHRDRAVAMAREAGAPVYIVETRASDSAALPRLRARYDSGLSASDGRPELLEWHRSQAEPVSDEEADGRVVVDNEGTVREAARTMLYGLWRAMLRKGT